MTNLQLLDLVVLVRHEVGVLLLQLRKLHLGGRCDRADQQTVLVGECSLLQRKLGNGNELVSVLKHIQISDIRA